MDTKKANGSGELKCCSHPTLIMELAYGGPTGNFICMECQRLLSATTNQQVGSLKNDRLGKSDYPLRLPGFIL